MRLAEDIHVFDDAVANPVEYRAAALEQEFRVFTFGPDVFRGIAPTSAEAMPGLTPALSFFRKSPLGQAEPNFVHDDGMMGDWTSILYLNPDPPEGDGTDFWEKPSGDWVKRLHVEAKFNRLLVFRGSLPHSRSIPENYGEGDSARLIQVTFWRGELAMQEAA